jgi:hypothetical protein
MGAADECLSKEKAMKYSMLIVAMLFMWVTTSHAEMDFDQRYERDYNIFNPVTQYQPNNPLNPANAYDPDSAFNPINRYDPGNPANPINKYSPNNPFNPVNQYHPDNPLNPVNKYNLDVPFAPLDGRASPERCADGDGKDRYDGVGMVVVREIQSCLGQAGNSNDRL